MVSSPIAEKVGQDEIELKKDGQEPPFDSSEENVTSSLVFEIVEQDEIDLKKDNKGETVGTVEAMNNAENDLKVGSNQGEPDVGETLGYQKVGEGKHVQKEHHSESSVGVKPLQTSQDAGPKVDHHNKQDDLPGKIDESTNLESRTPKETGASAEGYQREKKEAEPVFDGIHASEDDVPKVNHHNKQDDLPGKIDKSTNLESKIPKETGGSAEGIQREEKEAMPVFDGIHTSEDDGPKVDHHNKQDDLSGKIDESTNLESRTLKETGVSAEGILREDKEAAPVFYGVSPSKDDGPKIDHHNKQDDLPGKIDECTNLESRTPKQTGGSAEGIQHEEKEAEPVFDGTEDPGMEDRQSLSLRSLDLLMQNQEFAKDKAVALTNFVKEKGVVAASTVSDVLRRLSFKRDETGSGVTDGGNTKDGSSPKESEAKEASQKTREMSTWNPLSYIIMSRDADVDNNAEQKKVNIEVPQPITMRGRIIMYTRLGCQESKKVRLFLYMKRLRYVEINIDLYPGRKQELEKFSGSSSVPKVFFNGNLIGGLSELEQLDESGTRGEKINYLVTEPPSFEAPLPPHSGEDDMSNSGSIDELAVIVRKMKGSIVVKDRFYKMRMFTKCFLGSEAVDFISEDQYLERKEAIEFGQKLAGNLFFQHVLNVNIFEDGNDLYRFLDDDPIVSSQCHNIPRGIIDAKQKPIAEIASRLRLLSYSIFEAYASEDGKHVDYRTIHGSEEFARYLRTVEELQRVELKNMPREEKIAFFINLYNMMAIHSILVWGYPVGPLERRRMFGDFKYVIAGCTYSLSAIQNGILRGNERPPYNLLKLFGMNDRRSVVALPYPEPLIHFTLVSGSRSGPALRCYSPCNIDVELMEAARNFLTSGGLTVDLQNNVVLASMILKWFSVDFGKNEMEVLRHTSNYLEAKDREVLLELLSRTDQFKVVYHPYDWGVNC